MTTANIQAVAHSGTTMLTLRYGKDGICPAERVWTIARQIPSASGPPAFLKNKLKDKASQATLTDYFREGKKAEIQAVSDQAISHVIRYLSEYLG